MTQGDWGGAMGLGSGVWGGGCRKKPARGGSALDIYDTPNGTSPALPWGKDDFRELPWGDYGAV